MDAISPLLQRVESNLLSRVLRVNLSRAEVFLQFHKISLFGRVETMIFFFVFQLVHFFLQSEDRLKIDILILLFFTFFVAESLIAFFVVFCLVFFFFLLFVFFFFFAQFVFEIIVIGMKIFFHSPLIRFTQLPCTDGICFRFLLFQFFQDLFLHFFQQCSKLFIVSDVLVAVSTQAQVASNRVLDLFQEVLIDVLVAPKLFHPSLYGTCLLPNFKEFVLLRGVYSVRLIGYTFVH
mmetsp:Transcript_6658/g.11363  ORF Transcript_6658/g.11363 Transcript_6658/m.11363 type:complete len:235 (-) Transcript_6658:1674-2378(-)